MTTEGLRPIRCQSCGKLICEADGTVVFRCPRCKRLSQSVGQVAQHATIPRPTVPHGPRIRTRCSSHAGCAQEVVISLSS